MLLQAMPEGGGATSIQTNKHEIHCEVRPVRHLLHSDLRLAHKDPRDLLKEGKANRMDL